MHRNRIPNRERLTSKEEAPESLPTAEAVELLDAITACPNEMTVEFTISSITRDDVTEGAFHRIFWIHPAHIADHCYYFDEVPGDLPNFYVEVQDWDGPSEILDDLKTDDGLEAWLQELQSTGATTI